MLFLRTAMRRVARRTGWPVAAVLFAVVCFAGKPIEAWGQQPGVTASGFLPRGVTRQNQRLEQQLEALAADEAWAEMLELLESVSPDRDRVVESERPATGRSPLGDPAGHSRYVPLSQWRQQRLATLPVAARQVWRERVRTAARRQLEEAINRLDERELARIAEEFFATPAAGEALLAAGELAMERGDHTAARRWLGRVHPLVSDPFGRPAGAAMVTIDPDADPPTLAAAWRAEPRPSDLLTAPADDELLPVTLARLALVSIREGDLRRAAGELQLLKALTPNATGRIAGREQPFAAALEALIAGRTASEPPRPFGTLSRGWETALLPRVNIKNEPPPNQGWVDQRGPFRNPIAALQRRLQLAALRPRPLQAAAVGDAVFYLRYGLVCRTDLLTGETTPFALPGLEAAQAAAQKNASLPEAPNQRNLAFQNNPRRVVNDRLVQFDNGRRGLRIGPNGAVTLADPEPAPPAVVTRLFPDRNRLIARVGLPTPRGSIRRPNLRGLFRTSANYLLGVDGNRPAETAFRLELPETEEKTPWRFGSTLATRDNLLVALVERQGTRREVGVACYDTRSSELRWLTELGSGSRIGSNPGAPEGSITLVGDTAYVSTGPGCVGALDVSRGAIRWITAFPSSPLADASAVSVIAGDRVLAVTGSDQLTAWDAATGRALWRVERPSDAEILGVVRDLDRSIVVLAGRRVSAYDTLTGDRIFAWPDNDHGGVRGFGSAILRGGEVFWPTRDTLYTLDALTGRLTRPPRDLAALGGAGSLLATDHGLLIAGAERIRLLTDDPPPTNAEPASGVSRLMDPADPALTAKLTDP